MKNFKATALLSLFSIAFSASFAATPNVQTSSAATPASSAVSAPVASSNPKIVNAPAQDQKKDVTKPQSKSPTKGGEDLGKAVGHVKASSQTPTKHANINIAPQSKATKIKAS